VVDKDTDENVIFVSHGYDPAAQYGDKICLTDFQYITEDPFKDYSMGVDITFKIRHTPEFIKGKLFKTDDQFHIKSAEQIAGIAPGQFGVVYDADEKVCLGSGVIS